MATIQIRDIPEETYETLRRRARAEGQSIQAYMLDRVVELAASPSKRETVRRIDQLLAGQPSVDDRAAVVADIAADRR
jgi:plasmid stability protein